MKKAATLLTPFFLGVALAGATGAPALPSYQPGQPVSGVIHVWGNAQTGALLQRWQAGFRKYHPQADFATKLTGSDVGMAGLYTSQADIALLGRESGAQEGKGFEWVFGYKPQRVEIMTGSLDQPGKSPALVLFVHRDNPLAKLTLTQVDAIFSFERRRGAPENIRTWGRLGLTGEWADRPINLYGYDADTGTGLFFQDAALAGSRKMNWDHLTEFADDRSAGVADDAGSRILAALAKDRFGLAVAHLGTGQTGIKALVLSTTSAGPFVEATRETLLTRQYPLARPISAYINHKPGAPVDPKVAEFLRYILSAEGQQEIGAGTGYIPLDAANLREQRLKLQ